MKKLYPLFVCIIALACINSCTKTELSSSSVNSPNISNAVAIKSVIYLTTKKGFCCIDAATGKTKWNYLPSYVYDQPGGSTPVFNGGNVVFNLGDSLYALDMITGEKKWSSFCRHFNSAICSYGYRLYVGTHFGIACFNGNNGAPIWFHRYMVNEQKTNHNSSPTVENDVVYVGGASDNNLYALDAATGNLIWKKSITVFGAYSSPCWYNNKLYMQGDSSVFVFNASNGKLLWQKKFPFKFYSQSPSTFNGNLYISADSFYCLNPDDGNRIWAFGDTSAAHNGCYNDAFIDNQAVYVAFLDKFYKLDAYTGAEQWFGINESLREDMIAANGRIIYHGFASGRLYANATADDAPIWVKFYGGAYDYYAGAPISLDQYGTGILPVVSGNRQ